MIACQAKKREWSNQTTGTSYGFLMKPQEAIHSIAPGNSEAHTKRKQLAAASLKYHHVSRATFQTRRASHLHQNPDHAGSEVIDSHQPELPGSAWISLGV